MFAPSCFTRSSRNSEGARIESVGGAYASALVDVALEKKQADQVKQELAAFAAMVRESDELHAFLANPSIARQANTPRSNNWLRAWARAAHCAIICCDCRPAPRRNVD